MFILFRINHWCANLRKPVLISRTQPIAGVRTQQFDPFLGTSWTFYDRCDRARPIRAPFWLDFFDFGPISVRPWLRIPQPAVENVIPKRPRHQCVAVVIKRLKVHQSKKRKSSVYDWNGFWAFAPGPWEN